MGATCRLNGGETWFPAETDTGHEININVEQIKAPVEEPAPAPKPAPTTTDTGSGVTVNVDTEFTVIERQVMFVLIEWNLRMITKIEFDAKMMELDPGMDIRKGIFMNKQE
jgi:hypothetical protein